MFVLFCRCRGVWVCGLYLSLWSFYMMFYVVCYVWKSEEGNASQIICFLWSHYYSVLLKHFLSLNRCHVPFPFVGILGQRDKLYAWAITPLGIWSYAVCEGGCELARFCVSAQNVHSWAGKKLDARNAMLVIPFLCFDLPAQGILSSCF